MENFFLEIFAGIWQVIAAVLRAFSPLIIGLVLAYLFNAPTEWLRKKFFVRSQELLTEESPKGRIPAIIMSYTLAAVLLILIVYAFLILILGALPEGGFYHTLQQVYNYFDSASADIKNFISRYIPAGMDAADLAPASMISGWIEEHFSLEKLVRTHSQLFRRSCGQHISAKGQGVFSFSLAEVSFFGAEAESAWPDKRDSR